MAAPTLQLIQAKLEPLVWADRTTDTGRDRPIVAPAARCLDDQWARPHFVRVPATTRPMLVLHFRTPHGTTTLRAEPDKVIAKGTELRIVDPNRPKCSRLYAKLHEDIIQQIAALLPPAAEPAPSKAPNLKWTKGEFTIARQDCDAAPVWGWLAPGFGIALHHVGPDGAVLDDEIRSIGLTQLKTGRCAGTCTTVAKAKAFAAALTAECPSIPRGGTRADSPDTEIARYQELHKAFCISG